MSLTLLLWKFCLGKHVKILWVQLLVIYRGHSIVAGIPILWDSPLLPCFLGLRYVGYIVDGARRPMICLLRFDSLWISMINSIYSEKNVGFFMKNGSYWCVYGKLFGKQLEIILI